MKLSTNTVVQVLANTVHLINLASGVLSPKGKAWCALIVGLLQSGSAIIAHFYNIDGQSQKLAYRPPPPFEPGRHHA